MTEVWKNIFKENIRCYEALRTLREYEIMDEEEITMYELKLLDEIIETMKSEVEE